MRQADLLQLATKAFVYTHAGFDLSLHFSVESDNEVFFWNSNAGSLNRFVETLHVIIDGGVGRRRIEVIEPGDDLQRLRGFPHGFRERTNLIERRAKCHQTVSRNATVCWFQTDYSAKRGRCTHRPSRIRAERNERCSGSITGGRPADGAPMKPNKVMRVECDVIAG